MTIEATGTCRPMFAPQLFTHPSISLQNPSACPVQQSQHISNYPLHIQDYLSPRNISCIDPEAEANITSTCQYSNNHKMQQ